MTETLTTKPTEWPLTLDQLKAHARVTVNDDDTLLQMYLESATKFTEQYCNRSMLTQTWTKYLGDFPRFGHGAIYLDRKPIQSVDAILYLDADGVQQTLATSVYRLDAPGRRITTEHGQSWPATRHVTNAVEVAYITGSVQVDDVPEELVHAVVLIAKFYYDCEAVQPLADQLPLPIRAMLDAQKAFVL